MTNRQRVRRRGLLGLGLALAPAIALAAAGGKTGTTQAATSGRPTPAARRQSQRPPDTTALVVSAISTPMGVLGDDGMEHVAYDLTLTNLSAGTVMLSAIEVIDLDNGRTVLRLEGEALAVNIQSMLFVGGPPAAEVPVSGTVAAMIDLIVPPGQIPARITHRISYDLAAGAPFRSAFGGFQIDGPEVTVDRRRPMVIAPPLRGNGWFNSNSLGSPDAPHRNFRLAVDGLHYTKPETFAIDWLQLKDDLMATGDGSRNDQYFCFGAEILSATDGTVVSIRDDMPEETPNQPPAHLRGPGDYAGNHVVVEVAPGVFAAYAHLQLGSVSVRTGDRVTTGRLLGRLGNTGSTSNPHLHFQLSDGPDIITANSLPFVLDRYTLAGTVAPEALAAAMASTTAPTGFPVTPTSKAQTGTYPLLLSVIDIP